MKIGCCIAKSQIEGWPILDRFDFIEAKFSDIVELSDSFRKLHVYALNNLFRRDKNIFDQKLSKTFKAIDHIFKLVEKHKIGFLTLGSGGARKFLSHHSVKVNIEKWIKILTYIEHKAETTHSEVGIEPLGNFETNFLNTIPEVAFYIDQLKLKKVGITADTFHFFDSDASLKGLERHVEKIKHIHISSDERKFPTAISKRNKQFLDIIKKSSFDKNISIEIDWRETLENDPNIIYLLKKFFHD